MNKIFLNVALWCVKQVQFKDLTRSETSIARSIQGCIRTKC